MTETDPYRIFETALREARAATHERKLDAPVAKAFAAVIAVGGAAVDLARAQKREIDDLRDRVRVVEGRFFGDP